MGKLEDERYRLVVKDNELIQKCSYNLTVNQYKVIAYVISKIKPTDTEFKWIEIDVSDYCEMCGIDRNHFYTELKDMIDNLDNKTFWVETYEKVFKFRWFSEVEVIKGGGKIRVLLNSNLNKYLLNLQRKFTYYELINILVLKSMYAIRLYELFKSYEFQHSVTFETEELKRLLDATNYKNFYNFKVRCLEVAVNEINKFTDLNISYEFEKKGKKVIAIKFKIIRKEVSDLLISIQNTKDRIG